MYLHGERGAGRVVGSGMGTIESGEEGSGGFVTVGPVGVPMNAQWSTPMSNEEEVERR